MNKKVLKQRIYGCELRCIGLINNGLVNHEPKRDVLKKVRKEIDRTAKRINLSVLNKNQIYLEMYSLYQRISKRTFSKLKKLGADNVEERQNAVYLATRGKLIELEKNKNKVADRKEFDVKHDEIYGEEGLLKSNQNSSDYTPFFICSTHLHPAKDHEKWEGKMYYDEEWERHVSNPAIRASVKQYIRKHRLASIQWVLGPPVFLVTRRNCKHYFVKVPVEEVLDTSISVRDLLKKNDMFMEDEHNMTYAEMRKQYFYERLKALLYLNSICPSQLLEHDIRLCRNAYRYWAKRCSR